MTASVVSRGPALSRAELAALASRWLALWQGQDRDAFDDLHDPAFVDNSPAGRAADRAAFRAGIKDLYRAFPDFMAIIADLLIDEPRQSVAVRWTAKATHRGAFMGYPATGRSIDFTGIEIIRCGPGRIVERWGEWHDPALEAQLRPPA